MTGNDLTLVSSGVHQNPLNQIVPILISCDYFSVSMLFDEKSPVFNILSISGIRGRSARPVQTRER